MKQRRPLQEELTEAVHSEFTIDALIDQQHRMASARASVRLGLVTAPEAVEYYGFILEQIVTPV